MNIYQWLCVAGVPTIIALIWTTILKRSIDKATQKADDDRKRSQAIEDGVRDVLRILILDTYESCANNGNKISVSRKDAMNRAYKSYSTLGGNDTITHIHDKINAMDIMS